jgi:hypothetical protein
MANKRSKISFSLIKIVTEQFAIIDDAYSENDKIGVKSNIRFGVNKENRQIACSSEFTLNSDDKPFIILKSSCYFELENSSWKRLIDKEASALIAPRSLLIHLAVLAIGASRGILHAKTENTCFNRFILPIIDVSEVIREDAAFELK